MTKASVISTAGSKNTACSPRCPRVQTILAQRHTAHPTNVMATGRQLSNPTEANPKVLRSCKAKKVASNRDATTIRRRPAVWRQPWLTPIGTSAIGSSTAGFCCILHQVLQGHDGNLRLNSRIPTDSHAVGLTELTGAQSPAPDPCQLYLPSRVPLYTARSGYRGRDRP